MQRFPSTVRAFVALTILAAAIAVPNQAATVRRLDLDEVRSRAESVFTGQVVGVTAKLGNDGKMVWTEYQIDVEESLAGRDPGSTTTLSFAGGTLGSLSFGIPGVPELREGDHYLFFIEPRPDSLKPAIVPTVGWGQGLYRIVKVENGGMSQTALVSADGEPLELAPGGLLTRGALVGVSGNTIVEPESAVHDTVGIRVQKSSFEAADGSTRTFVATPEVAEPAARPVRSFATLDDLRLFAQGRLGAVSSRNR
ncbi:MAG: hypothetical protein HYU52_00315 [Acidobacteria bacterium]|nr:hypothetical protein [Acidobacteriota bacterium]